MRHDSTNSDPCEPADLKQTFEEFVAFAATCRRINQPEWMQAMLHHLNDVVTLFVPSGHYELAQNDYFRLRVPKRSEQNND